MKSLSVFLNYYRVYSTISHGSSNILSEERSLQWKFEEMLNFHHKGHYDKLKGQRDQEVKGKE